MAFTADRWIPLLMALANRADELAMSHFRSPDLAVDEKPDASPVSEADRAIEAAVRELLARHHPQLGVLGEEFDDVQGSSGTRLIIDPIDGTRSFVRSMPLFATLLAIEEGGEVEGGGEVVAGVVSAPALHARWHAARGFGAFCGSRRLRVSSIASWASAQLFHGGLGGSSETPPPPGFRNLLDRCERSRGLGDFYQHVLVAEGSGELAIDPVVHPWDIAPLQVIVEEAGGKITTFEGERSIYRGSVVSTNGILHEDALRQLASGSAS